MCAIHSTKETTTAESPSANTRVLRHSKIGKWSRTINTARLRSEKLNMRCTCCLFMLTLWSAAAGCNNRMPMCIGSFSLHSKCIGLSKRYPNSSVLQRDVESDRLIGNYIFSSYKFLTQKKYLQSTQFLMKPFLNQAAFCWSVLQTWPTWIGVKSAWCFSFLLSSNETLDCTDSYWTFGNTLVQGVRDHLSLLTSCIAIINILAVY